ncbi:MAG: tetratricopeptide repeat protein, partial [Ekhidna sp.]|nr:tetratricopeptide repeat protein [Ekhidna sp.]
TDRANYHLAEIAMREEQFELAIGFYNRQTSLDHLSNYGIGYGLYNLERYAESIPFFTNATRSSNQEVALDARVRLADCFYATKEYQEALSQYELVASETSSSYVIYQKGIVLRNLGRTEESLAEFLKIFDSPRFGDQAVFQTGMIRFEAANFDMAQELFTRLIEDQNSNDFLVEAYLNRGISFRNLGALSDAKNDFVFILENHLATEATLNAILGLQELEQDGEEIPQLEQYISAYKEANPNSESLELIEFEAAKRLYFNFSYVRSSESFDEFLSTYPESTNVLEATYYLADSYYRAGLLDDALIAFDKIREVKNLFTGRVLTRIGEINKVQGDSLKSLDAYKQLEALDLSHKDTYNALWGSMILYFEMGDYSKAIEKANQIIASEWKPLNGDKESILIKAKSYFLSDEIELSEELFNALSAGTDAFAAESKYYLGLIKYQSAQYNDSLEILFALNAGFGSYQNWVDKSYLLIAKNYLAKEELFQAKATLRSIIQHSENEGVKTESRFLLNSIENQEPKIDTLENER